MKWALAAMLAVLAFSTIAVGSASAFVPLFLTESKATLLFLAESVVGSVPTLRALNLGAAGTITCEKALAHGFVLDKSTLVHFLPIEFHGKCKQVVGASEGTCSEPIATKPVLGELGLATSHTVLLLLQPSAGSSTFVTVQCTNGNTTVDGAVIGEIPEINAVDLETQYNVLLTKLELVFESEGKNSESQKYTKIELLGVSMPGELKVEGFFGGKASEEVTSIIKPNGGVEICTKTPANCP